MLDEKPTPIDAIKTEDAIRMISSASKLELEIPGHPDAIPLLVEFTALHPDATVRKAAEEAIAALDVRWNVWDLSSRDLLAKLDRIEDGDEDPVEFIRLSESLYRHPDPAVRVRVKQVRAAVIARVMVDEERRRNA